MDTTINFKSPEPVQTPYLPPHVFINENKFDEILNKLNTCMIKCDQNQNLIIKLFEILHKK